MARELPPEINTVSKRVLRLATFFACAGVGVYMALVQEFPGKRHCFDGIRAYYRRKKDELLSPRS
ncbi:Uncharacterized protein PBTT_10481 [Plasmodiophora brassicae]|nr:hypothetical protein PBRA_007545 [Plasmodiophora brassicae]